MKAPRSDRWLHVNQMFDAVLDLEPRQREGFLRKHCSDPSIRREVESLLKEVEAADAAGFLDRPIHLETDALYNALSDVAQAAEEEPFADFTGRQVGPYRIERMLGRGGMGAVFLARRADGEYEQQVALKIMRRDVFQREDLVARLRRERQILASLDHEHVARLLDGGVDDEGRPYLVMEYIDGEPLDAYCDRRSLDMGDRLRLFKQVGDAVAAAHRRAVIHRDLKPSNVLIQERDVGRNGETVREPQAKLLDFGIAKLTESDEIPKDAPLTRTGMTVMTPEYAAPEQIQGTDVTTATDVYQLGVVLYELLTGQRPFHDTTNGTSGRAHLRALEEAILSTDPKRPSTAVTRLDNEVTRRTRNAEPVQLARHLRGDLDAICLKALRKEPGSRYLSVDAFMEDVARYLDGRPVEARRGTAWYRMQKFARRRWKGVVTGLAFIVVLVGGGVFYTTQISAERDRAEMEAQKAEEVTEFLISLFNASNPYAVSRSPEDIRVTDILETAEEKLRAEGTNDPILQATLLHAVGRVYNRVSEYDKAGKLLREAQAMRLEILGPDPTWMVESYDEIATHYLNTGNYTKALAASDTALTASIEAFGRDSDEHASVVSLIATIHNEGREKTGTLKEAEMAYREAIRIRRSLGGDQDRTIAGLMDGLGANLIYQKRLSEADSVLQSALTLKRKTVDPTSWDISTTLNNLAGVHQKRGQHADAIPLLREAVSIRKAIIGDHPDIGTALSNLGQSLIETDSLSEAESVLNEGLGIYQRTLGPDHNWNAYIIRRLSSLHRKRGEYTMAESRARDALRIDRNAGFEETNWRIIYDRNVLADALIAQEKFGEAEETLMPMAEILRSTSPDELPGDVGRRSSGVYRRLVTLYEKWGRPETALQWEERREQRPQLTSSS